MLILESPLESIFTNRGEYTWHEARHIGTVESQYAGEGSRKNAEGNREQCQLLYMFEDNPPPCVPCHLPRH